MILPSGALLGLLPLALSAATTSITIQIPTTGSLPNPYALPPSTHGTLSATGTFRRSAPLSAANTVVFHNVSAGSYLLDVHCATHAFAPLRVDVVPAVAGTGPDAAAGDPLDVLAWETYRGNDWDNKGEQLQLGGGENRFEARVLGPKRYYMERSGFSVFGILKNPMILLGLVSMGIFVGMPYLVNNSKSRFAALPPLLALQGITPKTPPVMCLFWSDFFSSRLQWIPR